MCIEFKLTIIIRPKDYLFTMNWTQTWLQINSLRKRKRSPQYISCKLYDCRGWGRGIQITITQHSQWCGKYMNTFPPVKRRKGDLFYIELTTKQSHRTELLSVGGAVQAQVGDPWGNSHPAGKRNCRRPWPPRVALLVLHYAQNGVWIL